ncbi:MAG: alpha/beta hydrolase [Erysipelotrichaceae bacterium]|nr:alpha/beta hydrolase [Erysipelotrichaceae bacterium]
MALITINDVVTNYSQSGTAGRPVILLHGWGQNTEMMAPIEEHLADRFRVFNLDLPGFGQSAVPAVSWSVYDYANHLKQFINVFKLYEPIIIAHSFGARLAIIYAANNPVYKMVITGGAGILEERTADYYLRVYSYKLAKKTLKLLGLTKYQEALQRTSGSSDYQKTNGVMRESFIKIVNEDLSKYLEDIKAEVLLVWGENDEATPLWMGQKMAELIPGAGLAVFEGDDHYAYYHQMARFLRVIDVFLANDGEVTHE